MSECHDIYDPIESSTAPEVRPVGAQCHDSYLAVPDDDSPAHDCCVASSHRGAVRVLRVDGCLDWATEHNLRDLLRDHCSDRSVIVDLSGARLDAAGTGVVLAATVQATKRDQQLVFVVTDPVELEVLSSTGVSAIAPVVASMSEALAWLGATDGTSPAMAIPTGA